MTPEQHAAEIMAIKNNGKRRRLIKRLARVAENLRLVEQIKAHRERRLTQTERQRV